MKRKRWVYVPPKAKREPERGTAELIGRTPETESRSQSKEGSRRLILGWFGRPCCGPGHHRSDHQQRDDVLRMRETREFQGRDLLRFVSWMLETHACDGVD